MMVETPKKHHLIKSWSDTNGQTHETPQST
jgi:hypothetical protein